MAEMELDINKAVGSEYAAIVESDPVGVELDELASGFGVSIGMSDSSGLLKIHSIAASTFPDVSEIIGQKQKRKHTIKCYRVETYLTMLFWLDFR